MKHFQFQLDLLDEDDGGGFGFRGNSLVRFDELKSPLNLN